MAIFNIKVEERIFYAEDGRSVPYKRTVIDGWVLGKQYKVELPTNKDQAEIINLILEHGEAAPTVEVRSASTAEKSSFNKKQEETSEDGDAVPWADKLTK